MRRGFLFAAIVGGLLALAPTMSRAESLHVGMLATPHSPALGWLSTSMIAADAGAFQLAEPRHPDEDEATIGRRHYQFITALPHAQSVEHAIFDVSPIVALVTYQKLVLTPDVRLTFIAGRNLVVAEIAGKASVSAMPVGFGSGATFSLAAHF